MTNREKLIEVFMHLDKHINNHDEYGVCYSSDFVEAIEAVLQMLKNGVTVQQQGCEYCNGLPKSERDCFTMPNASKRDYDIVTIKFCPMCGRRLPEPPKGD